MTPTEPVDTNAKCRFDLETFLKSYAEIQVRRIYYEQLADKRRNLDKALDLTMFMVALAYLFIMFVFDFKRSDLSGIFSGFVVTAELVLYYWRSSEVFPFLKQKQERDYSIILAFYHAVESIYRKFYEKYCDELQKTNGTFSIDSGNKCKYNPNCLQDWCQWSQDVEKVRRRMSAMLVFLKPHSTGLKGTAKIRQQVRRNFLYNAKQPRITDETGKAKVSDAMKALELWFDSLDKDAGKSEEHTAGGMEKPPLNK